MKIGYARVSTLEQNPDLQHNALKKAGCKKIYTDNASGVKTERPALNQILEHIRKGDCLVVWRLNRLGRSLKYLIDSTDLICLIYVGYTQDICNSNSAGFSLAFFSKLTWKPYAKASTTAEPDAKKMYV